MLRRAITLFLLFLFLITNSGFVPGVHWCGGKKSSFEFYSDGDHHCKCGKKTMKSSCCKNVSVHLKASQELMTSHQFITRIIVSYFVFDFLDRLDSISLTGHSFASADYYYRPLFKPKVPLYILDGVFLI